MILQVNSINVQEINISKLHSFLQTIEQKGKSSIILCDTSCNLDSNTQERWNEKEKLEPNLTHECKWKHKLQLVNQTKQYT